MIGPKVDVPSGLSELVLIGNGAIVRIQQVGQEWIGVLHHDGEFDRAFRADTRDELLTNLEVLLEKEK